MPRAFRRPESLVAERETRDQLKPFLESLGSRVVDDHRTTFGSSESQTIQAITPSGEEASLRVKICWRYGRKGKSRGYSAAQLVAKTKPGHTAFGRAILESLVEMGGSGKTREMLDMVGEKMERVLKLTDHAALPSGGKSMRWRNAAQWARNTMVNEDVRMKKTRGGIWEISEKGRQWLKKCN